MDADITGLYMRAFGWDGLGGAPYSSVQAFHEQNLHVATYTII